MYCTQPVCSVVTGVHDKASGEAFCFPLHHSVVKLCLSIFLAVLVCQCMCRLPFCLYTWSAKALLLCISHWVSIKFLVTMLWLAQAHPHNVFICSYCTLLQWNEPECHYVPFLLPSRSGCVHHVGAYAIVASVFPRRVDHPQVSWFTQPRKQVLTVYRSTWKSEHNLLSKIYGDYLWQLCVSLTYYRSNYVYWK